MTAQCPPDATPSPGMSDVATPGTQADALQDVSQSFLLFPATAMLSHNSEPAALAVPRGRRRILAVNTEEVSPTTWQDGSLGIPLTPSPTGRGRTPSVSHCNLGMPICKARSACGWPRRCKVSVAGRVPVVQSGFSSLRLVVVVLSVTCCFAGQVEAQAILKAPCLSPLAGSVASSASISRCNSPQRTGTPRGTTVPWGT